jgi:hypothetical protein
MKRREAQSFGRRKPPNNSILKEGDGLRQIFGRYIELTPEEIIPRRTRLLLRSKNINQPLLEQFLGQYFLSGSR